MISLKIHLEDVHVGIKQLPDDSVDFIYCNPPFGITECEWDQPLSWYRLWPEIWRVLKPSGVVAIHCSQPFTTDLISSQRRLFRYVWYWHKIGCPATNHWNIRYQPRRNIEEIAVFAKAGYNYHPPVATAPTHLLEYPRMKGKHTRPAELIDFMLSTYATAGDTVLDLTTGCGETALRCLHKDMSFIGYQINEDHLGPSVKSFVVK